MKKLVYLILIVVFLSSCDKEKNYLRDGNKEFDKKQYSNAEDYYRKALNIDSTYKKANYNLANSAYKQNKEESYTKSIMYYDRALSQDSIFDTTLFAHTLYNRGNANFKLALLDSVEKGEKYNEGLRKAIDDYKKTLRLNDKDSAAKYNLVLAMHLLNKNKQNNQNQNKQNQKDKNQNQETKQQNQDSQNRNQETKNQNQEIKQGSKNQDKERMLEALKNNEKNTLDKIKKDKNKNPQQNRNARDW